MADNDFNKTWVFPSKIKEELGADSYEIRTSVPLRKFNSGRTVMEMTFYNGYGDKQICIEKRDAMTLLSKRTGKEYSVVKATSE